MKMQTTKDRDIKINTTALPDIIFMLLFFFMVTTVMQTQTINELSLPKVYGATQQGNQNSDELHIYLYTAEGKAWIKVNEHIQPIEKSHALISQVTNQNNNNGNHLQKANLYIDADTPMSSVNSVKEVLQELHIYKVKYLHDYSVM